VEIWYHFFELQEFGITFWKKSALDVCFFIINSLASHPVWEKAALGCMCFHFFLFLLATLLEKTSYGMPAKQLCRKMMAYFLKNISFESDEIFYLHRLKGKRYRLRGKWLKCKRFHCIL
jgi:hypothetical protein